MKLIKTSLLFYIAAAGVVLSGIMPTACIADTTKPSKLALLVGVERANTAERRAFRAAFVENLLTHIPVLEFALPVARTHARMIAAMPKNVTATAHDALIAATAIHHGFHLLTRNTADFKIFAGLKLEAYGAV